MSEEGVGRVARFKTSRQRSESQSHRTALECVETSPDPYYYSQKKTNGRATDLRERREHSRTSARDLVRFRGTHGPPVPHRSPSSTPLRSRPRPLRRAPNPPTTGRDVQNEDTVSPVRFFFFKGNTWTYSKRWNALEHRSTAGLSTTRKDR